MTLPPPVVVVVIDDDDQVRDALTRLLHALGFSARALGTAEAFLDEPDHSAIGCLVLDVTLPGMSGISLEQELKRRGERLPVVFITGGDDPMTSAMSREAGWPLLRKPFPAKALVAAIETATSRDRNAA